MRGSRRHDGDRRRPQRCVSAARTQGFLSMRERASAGKVHDPVLRTICPRACFLPCSCSAEKAERRSLPADGAMVSRSNRRRRSVSRIAAPSCSGRRADLLHVSMNGQKPGAAWRLGRRPPRYLLERMD